MRSCLGTGSYGVVFDVYDTKADAQVALKWLRASDSGTLARFKREFRALADLVHPNLVGYRELIAIGGEWYFTMDLVAGVDLLGYVRSATRPRTHQERISGSMEIVVQTTIDLSRSPSRTPPARDLRPDTTADFGRLYDALGQLGAGLDALHAAGMVHRDVKPSNVLVTGEGRVVLLDLGLVTELGVDGVDMSKSGVIVGTPAYMSPEQAIGSRVGPAADWYSVGVILYQALTGAVPFEGAGQGMLVKKQLSAPRRPSSFVRGIPPELDELCLALLARDPEERLAGAAFHDALDRTFRGTLPPATPRASQLPPPTPRVQTDFIGRKAHLDKLEAALEEASNGKTVVAFVHGASGMGKSALVRHFLDSVKDKRRDVLVLEGRCYERESVPYRALDSLVDAACRALLRLPDVEASKLLPRDVDSLARVFPVFSQLVPPGRKRARGPIDAFEERRRAFEALRELLSRMGDRRTLVVSIDDFQWGDADSAPLIGALFRNPDPPPMLVLATYRSEDAATAPLVTALQKAVVPPVERYEIVVAELAPEASVALAMTLLGPRASQERARAIAKEAAGSPLFLRQLAAYGKGAASLETVITEQVAALPSDARRLLEVLAVAGQPLSLGVASRVADTKDAQGIASRLRSETLVRSQGSELEIFHERIRESVTRGIAPERVRELHEKVARGLSAGGDEQAEAVARHFELAGQRDLAAHYAETAADRASAALAFGRAATMYERAFALASEGGVELKLAEALVLAGRSHDAAVRFQSAAKSASAVDALELRRRAAEQMLFSGHIDEGLRLIDDLLDAMHMRSPKGPIGMVVSLVWRRFRLFLRGLAFRVRSADQLAREQLVRIDTCFSLGLGLGMIDPIRGADYQTRYLLLALDAGEPQRVAKGLAVEAVYRASDGTRQRPAVERLLAKAVAISPDDGALGVRLRFLRGATSFLLGDFKKAIDVCDEAMALAREKYAGLSWELDNAAALAGMSLIALGRIRELGERLPAQLDEARARGNLYAETLLRMQCGWFANLARDDAAAARADLATVWTKNRITLQNAWQLLNGVAIELYEGDGAAAWALVETKWPTLRRSLFTRAEGVRVALADARGRAALAAGRLDEARREARALAKERSPTARGQALVLEAGLETNEASAIDRMREAVAELERNDLMLHALCARHRLAEMVSDPEMLARVRADLEGRTIAKPEKLVRVFSPTRP